MTPLTPPALLPVAQVRRPVLPDREKVFLAPPEELLAGVLEHLTPAQLAAWRAAFGPYLGQPVYPLSIALRVIDWGAAVAYPDLPLAEARRRRGRDGLLVWRQQTLLGRALTATFPLLGLDRLLRQVPHHIATQTNFGSRWVIHEGPQHWWYGSSDDPTPPEFTAGILEALCVLTSVQDVTIRWEARTRHDQVYELRWTP